MYLHILLHPWRRSARLLIGLIPLLIGLLNMFIAIKETQVVSATGGGTCPSQDGWTTLSRPTGASSRLPSFYADRIIKVEQSWRDANELYAAGFGGLYKSNDCGASWKTVAIDLVDYRLNADNVIEDISIDQNGYILVAWSKDPITVGLNYGATWQLAYVPEDVVGMRLYPRADRLIQTNKPARKYASVTGLRRPIRPELYTSDDAGISWRPTRHVIDGYLVPSPDSPSRFYVASGNRISISDVDEGTMVEVGRTGEDADEGSSVRDLSISTADGRLVALTVALDLIASGDGGVSWMRLSHRPVGDPVTEVIRPRLSLGRLEGGVFFVTGPDGDARVYRLPADVQPVTP